MSGNEALQNAIEAAVAKALEQRIPELRAEIAREVGEAVAALIPEKHSPGAGPTDLLNAAIASIHDAHAQSEILLALLEGASRFSHRCALFVLRGGNLQGWQARGFESNDAIKSLQISGASGLAARAIQDHAPAAAAASDFDPGFVSTHGNPWDGNASLLPLTVRDKVPALLYVDAGMEAEATVDSSALQTLVRAASAWLELLALRKATPAEGAAAPPPAVAPPAPPAAAAPPPAAAPAPPAPAAAASAAAAPEPAAATEPAVATEDADVHKKAKRFAKLLVDEIKLYNQGKLAQARQQKQVYSVLREDIEKSRATYDKRFGSTPAASANYFNQELLRILADNDRSLLGSEFPE
jgi:hypothetical protein